MAEHILSDEQSDYHEIKQTAAKRMRRGVWQDRFEPRLVPFGDREMRCDLPKEAFRHLSEGKHYISYRGLPMAKDPLDLVLYEMLLFELQPRTIVELGAYTGASALWMRDRMRSFDAPVQIFSVDIDLSLVDDLARQADSVEFIEGDCHDIQRVFPADQLASWPKPLLLIDDAHVNIQGVYRHFHEHALCAGDYLVVEDTVPWIPGTFGKSDSEQEWGEWKWNEIREFFEAFDADYRVDRYFTDFFGYNATWNWNGYFRRV
jgi:cephalosporin hydroxylase